MKWSAVHKACIEQQAAMKAYHRKGVPRVAPQTCPPCSSDCICTQHVDGSETQSPLLVILTTMRLELQLTVTGLYMVPAARPRVSVQASGRGSREVVEFAIV